MYGPQSSASPLLMLGIAVVVGGVLIEMGKPFDLDDYYTIDNVRVYDARIVEFSPYFYGESKSHQASRQQQRSRRRRHHAALGGPGVLFAFVHAHHPIQHSMGVDVVIEYRDNDGAMQTLEREWRMPAVDYYHVGDELLVFELEGYKKPDTLHQHDDEARYILRKYADSRTELPVYAKPILNRLKRELVAIQSFQDEVTKYKRTVEKRETQTIRWASVQRQWEADNPELVPDNIDWIREHADPKW